MKYNQLPLQRKKSAKRLGRGIAAGQGKTAGRGTKGQNARTGSARKPGFEGGQNPLMQRLPKLHGFRSYKTKVAVVYTGQLDQFADKTVGGEQLAAAGLISSAYQPIKLIVKGELTKKLTVALPAASAAAIAAIEKAGGSFTPTPRLARPARKAKK